MSRDWSSSKVFKAIRRWWGIEKPFAAQWGEWDDWKINTSRDHPIGFWITEVLPHHLEWIPETFVDPFHNMSYYIRNRWHRQTHVLPCRFKPGTYHDLRERLLHGIMESIVDFVEVEKAWMMCIWHHDVETEGKQYKLDRRGRSVEAGLAHLDWEATLDNPELKPYERSDVQAATAREIKEIYHWWKEIRPNRPDPYEVSGWDAVHNKHGFDWFMDERVEKTEEEEKVMSTAHDKIREIEEAYDTEDEEMLIRVMKIRLSLWT